MLDSNYKAQLRHCDLPWAAADKVFCLFLTYFLRQTSLPSTMAHAQADYVPEKYEAGQYSPSQQEDLKSELPHEVAAHGHATTDA